MRILYLLLLSYIIIMFGCVDTWAQPKIEFKKKSHNFGISYTGQVLVVKFDFTNKGDTPLIITKIKKSCGCAKAIASATNILPDEKAFIKVSLKAGAPGKETQAASIITNDPSNPAVELKVLTTTHNLWSTTPDEPLFFKDVVKGMIQSKTFILSNKENDKFNIKTVKIKNPLFTAMIGEKNNVGIPITVNFTGGNIEGTLNEQLYIKTDHEKQPDVYVRLIGQTTGFIKFSPTRAFFRNVKVGETKTLEIIAKTHTQTEIKDLQLTDIKSDDGHVVGEIIGKDSDGQLRIKLTLIPEPKAGYQFGTIRMKTNIPQEENVILSYSALVTRP